MIRVKINVDATTDAWDNYRIAKYPDKLEEFIRKEIEDILKLSSRNTINTTEVEFIRKEIEDILKRSRMGKDEGERVNIINVDVKNLDYKWKSTNIMPTD